MIDLFVRCYNKTFHRDSETQLRILELFENTKKTFPRSENLYKKKQTAKANNKLYGRDEIACLLVLFWTDTDSRNSMSVLLSDNKIAWYLPKIK